LKSLIENPILISVAARLQAGMSLYRSSVGA